MIIVQYMIDYEITLFLPPKERYAIYMERITKTLTQSALQRLHADVCKKASEFSAIRETICAHIPLEAQHAFHIVKLQGACLTIEVHSLWLMWIKSHEQVVVRHLNAAFGIEHIKWRQNPHLATAPVAQRHTISLSPKSAAVVSAAAKVIEHDGLKHALEKLATRVSSSRRDS